MPLGHLYTELSSLFVFGHLEQNIAIPKITPGSKGLLTWGSCTQRTLGMHGRRKRRTKGGFSKHRASNVTQPLQGFGLCSSSAEPPGTRVSIPDRISEA